METEIDLTLDSLLHSSRSPHKPLPRPCKGIRLPNGQIRFAKNHEATVMARPAPIIRCEACRSLSQKVTALLAKGRNEVKKVAGNAANVEVQVAVARDRLRELVAAECGT